MKVSDFVIDLLARNGVTDVFTVSGGGIAPLLDSLGRNASVRYFCNYHEQACAVAAEGYARTAGRIGVCLVTVGPGAVNALAGIMGAWYDSIPVLVISGQVRTDLIADFTKVRQRGPQESNVIEMARAVTKYAISVRDASQIRYELEKALYSATSDRPGPVWVEIPFDIQGATVDEAELPGYGLLPSPAVLHDMALAAEVTKVIEAIREAKRPLLVGGNGIHLSRSEYLLQQILERMQIPIITPDAAKDLVPEEYPRYVGVFGTAGQRRANFAVQNSDCLLSLGVGLSLKKIGFNFKGFAPNAKKIVVDIDFGQLHHQVIPPDIAIQADVHEFMEELLRQLERSPYAAPSKWLDACASWKRRYPLGVDEYFNDENYVNSYVFVDMLSDMLAKDDIIVGGSGLDTVSCIQGLKLKSGQRSFTSINWGAMGWDLPLSIGACIANKHRRTICITGDGSIQMNIQELMTISYHRLPIKIFVFNNGGYASIRATQNALFEGRVVASDPTSGVGNPDFQKLAAAYNLGFSRIRKNGELENGIRDVLGGSGAVVCEVMIAPEQGITPKASTFRRPDGTLESRPLEDMAPFLPRDEIWQNMHMFDGEEEADGHDVNAGASAGPSRKKSAS
jgi:acetolactate synthase-1/2/3 large subunit